MGGGHDIATRGYPEEQVHRLYAAFGGRQDCRVWPRPRQERSPPMSLSLPLSLSLQVLVIADFDQWRRGLYTYCHDPKSRSRRESDLSWSQFFVCGGRTQTQSRADPPRFPPRRPYGLPRRQDCTYAEP